MINGTEHLVLDPGVVHLRPEEAAFEAMLAGWERQQQARFLRESTIVPRLTLVRRFADFSGLYPWQWTPGEVEAFVSSLVSAPRPLAHSTIRSYQVTLRLFCQYATDARSRRTNLSRATVTRHPQRPRGAGRGGDMA